MAPSNSSGIRIGLVAPPDLPPEDILRAARAAEAAGLAELWLWEDCFAHSGIAPAAAVLAATSGLAVGLGLMPVPLRAPSLTAMEIATVARMFPGRFRPGLGHGVQDWMQQAGVRVESPLTLLREHVEAIRDLLAGQQVTAHGRYVRLDEVKLTWPPEVVPELFVGGRGPKTLAVAGKLAAGAILDDVAPSGVVDLARLREAVGAVRTAREQAGREGVGEIAVVLPVREGASVEELRDRFATLHAEGVTTVTCVAGMTDGEPPAGDERVFELAELLGTC